MPKIAVLPRAGGRRRWYGGGAAGRQRPGHARRRDDGARGAGGKRGPLAGTVRRRMARTRAHVGIDTEHPTRARMVFGWVRVAQEPAQQPPRVRAHEEGAVRREREPELRLLAGDGIQRAESFQVGTADVRDDGRVGSGERGQG